MRLNVLELFTEAFDSETHDIAGTKVLWGLQSEPDALRPTSRDDIPGQESHEFTDVTHAFRHRKYHVGRVAVLATDFPDVAPQPETLRVSYLVLSYEPWPNRAKSIVALAALLQPPDQGLYAPIWTGLAAVLLSWGPVVATIGLAAGVAFLVSELRIRALISVEMRAARRWLPWLCAYSGARVNELTSLHPSDISHGPKNIHCMLIKPSLEKTAQWRVVPIHSDVIAQDFLKYVEERQKLNKPMFYDPDRSRGGKPGNPQFKKVAERLGEWVHGLGIPVGVKPSHAWRHLFKSVARHVKMDREVEGFITGHRPKDSNAGNDYGDRWIKTMSAEIEKYPRFKVAALSKPAPHKRQRRTNAEVAAAKAAKEKRKTARATRAVEAK
jgi:integrase